MIDNAVYTYQPTGRGIRYESAEPSDPERSTPCVLYPDNRRELLFDPEEMKKREKIPFRPFVLARLSPKYEIHFDNVGGMGGFGRLAFVRGAVPVFFDEFQHVTAEYENGEVRYTAQDDRISPDPVYVTFVSGRGACGLLIRVEICGWTGIRSCTGSTAACSAGRPTVPTGWSFPAIWSGAMSFRFPSPTRSSG
jgi:hypothetical protein